MVAYSFQPMFVPAIKVGLAPLGTSSVIGIVSGVTPKRQTIRSIGLKRHAMPGDTLQLYCRQRHPLGFKIGEARCVWSEPIRIEFRRTGAKVTATPPLDIIEHEWRTPGELDAFARRDGFADWQSLREFWRDHHASIFDEHGVGTFSGLLIEWEPLT